MMQPMPPDLPPFRITPAVTLGLLALLWVVPVILTIWIDIEDSEYPDEKEDA